MIVPINNPYLTYSAFAQPTRANNPTVIKVDTNAGYAINTANYNDLVYLNPSALSMTTNQRQRRQAVCVTTTTVPQKAD